MPLVVMEDRSGSGLDARAPGRLATMQNNVRAALLDIGTPSSSIYSRSPNMQQTPTQPTQEPDKTPKTRQLFGLVPRTGNTPTLRHMPNFHLPFGARAESSNYSPASQPTEWSRSPEQPAPPAQPDFRHPADVVPIISSDPDLEAGLPPKPKKHRRKHRRHAAWTRKRKTQNGSRTCAALFQGETRAGAIAALVSGVILFTILAIYLSVALTANGLSQQVHILFVLAILASLVFFAYSLIRLIVRATLRKNPQRRRPTIPSVSGPEGFKPDVPIRVQLARDEDLSDGEDDGKLPEEKADALRPPPPAYGLWRGSVRLDPNLLHWQRAGQATPGRYDQQGNKGSPLSERGLSPSSSPALESTAEEEPVRRPPSYASDDGVSYVVSALPPAPPSEIHPAFRIRLP